MWTEKVRIRKWKSPERLDYGRNWSYILPTEYDYQRAGEEQSSMAELRWWIFELYSR